MNFVSYEIAKKLKEKGFEEPCLAYFIKNEFIEFILRSAYYKGETVRDLYARCGTSNAYQYDAPTIDRVLEWLREDKGYHLCIAYNGDWMYDIVRISDTEFAGANDNYDTYEEAVVAGIEYVLDNLI